MVNYQHCPPSLLLPFYKLYSHRRNVLLIEETKILQLIHGHFNYVSLHQYSYIFTQYINQLTFVSFLKKKRFKILFIIYWVYWKYVYFVIDSISSCIYRGSDCNLYYSLVYSHLTYALLTWERSMHNNAAKIQCAHRRACKLNYSQVIIKRFSLFIQFLIALLH